MCSQTHAQAELTTVAIVPRLMALSRLRSPSTLGERTARIQRICAPAARPLVLALRLLVAVGIAVLFYFGVYRPMSINLGGDEP